MFISLEEVTRRTVRLKAFSEGPLAVSPAQQRLMLAAFLNATAMTLANPLMGRTPQVSIEYTKVTATPKRVSGTDFRGTPGLKVFAHSGAVVKVARNRNGDPYLVIADRNRAKPEEPGFTAVRLEGLLAFGLAEPSAQDQALGLAQNLVR